MKSPVSFEPATILCPVDFSKLSDLALTYAAAGARVYGAELVVFHAARLDLPAYFTRAQSDALLREHRAAQKRLNGFLRQQVHQRLGPHAEELRLHFDSADTHPAEAIPAAVKAHDADLIVMGTHGRTGARRLWLGSVTEQVVRESRVPVFIVRQKQPPLLPGRQSYLRPEIHTVLCPLDDSDTSRSVLQHAASVARKFRSRLVALRLIDRADQKGLTDARREFEKWWEEASVAAGESRVIASRGPAAGQILAETARSHADLIVLGTHLHRPLRNWWAGDTTEIVLRRAPVPVLVVPG